MRSRHIIAILGAFLVLGAITGCGKKALEGVMAANKPPQIEITCGAVLSTPDKPLTEPYSIHFCWAAFDPDGYVDHYEYATSDSDTVATAAAVARRGSTKLHEVTVKVQADIGLLIPGDSASVRQYPFGRLHQFFVRAVDNDGAPSPWIDRFFNALSIAPTTSLDFPHGQNGVVGPSMTARWHGVDIDATDPKHLPVRYHVFFKDITGRPAVLGTKDASDLMQATMNQPLGAGRNFYVGGDTTHWTFKLTSNHQYCLVVKSIDESGAEDPIPTLYVDKPGEEKIALINERAPNAAFFTSMPSGARPTLVVSAGSQFRSFNGYDVSNPLAVQVPPNVDLSFSWSATAGGYGGQVTNYSYALDIDDPTSPVPTVTQKGGFVWTSPDERATSAIIPGFPEKGLHYFFVKAYDDAGSFSIGVVQIEVIPVSFDRPLVFILDNTNIPSGSSSSSGMTAEEMTAYWRDILETDRHWVDFRDDASGRCAEVASRPGFLADSVIGNYGLQRAKFGIPLSTLSHFRVVVWYVPQTVPGSGFDYALKQLVTNSAVSNNLYTYLQAGGSVWASGGGFARWLIGAKGAGTVKPQAYPFIESSTTEADPKFTFYFDVLGLHGGPDTMFSTDGQGRAGTEIDARMRGMDPWPVPFVRQTAYGTERRQMPALTFDLGRLDTLPLSRFDPRVQQVPYPASNELLRGLPNEYNVNPDSATWQPIGVYRSLGRRPIANYSALQAQMWVDSSVVAWYKRGTTLTVVGGSSKLRAPYQLYYFGFDISQMQREQVRQLADIILSTKGWNIWRGSCPPQGARVTRERVDELQGNASRIAEFRKLTTGRRTRLQSAAPVVSQNRRR
jgi:hypothetical protein